MIDPWRLFLLTFCGSLGIGLAYILCVVVLAYFRGDGKN